MSDTEEMELGVYQGPLGKLTLPQYIGLTLPHYIGLTLPQYIGLTLPPYRGVTQLGIIICPRLLFLRFGYYWTIVKYMYFCTLNYIHSQVCTIYLIMWKDTAGSKEIFHYH